MKNVLIAGGTGLVGRNVESKLKEAGYHVSVLSRNPKGNDQFFWNPAEKEMDESVLANVHVLINVSGDGIGDKRWTEKRKQELYESRVEGNKYLFSLINSMPVLEHFVSSSGVNCYGYDQNERIHEETDQFGDDFLSQLVKAWEESADLFTEKCIVTKIRTAMVLDANHGALPRIIKPIKMGIGSPLGNGQQQMPWIHVEDLASIFAFSVEEKLAGSYNACAAYCSNEEFMKTIANILEKPFWAPNVPAFVLKALFGEMSSLILDGIMVSNQKIKSAGYEFKYPQLEKALYDVLIHK